MDKYTRVKNPPSIYTQMKFFGLIYLPDLAAVALAVFLGKQLNALFHLNNVFGFINYGFLLTVAFCLFIYRPQANPEERQYKLLYYAFILDKNRYHALPQVKEKKGETPNEY